MIKTLTTHYIIDYLLFKTQFFIIKNKIKIYL